MKLDAPEVRGFPEMTMWESPEKPFFVNEQGIIYNGRFQEVLGTLESNTVDLIVTDPPYGINYRGCDLSRRQVKDRMSRGNLMKNDSAEDAIAQLHCMLLFARRLLKPGGCCCLCCPGGARKLPVLLKWTQLISRYLILKELVIWDKGGLGLGSHYRQNYEYVIVSTKPGSRCVWRGNGREPNVVRVNRCVPRPDGHPTPKPVELMAHFIRLHSDEGSVVLDPFAGQGPTLVAAMNLNRKFIGIELDLEHCVAAAERLTSSPYLNGQSCSSDG